MSKVIGNVVPDDPRRVEQIPLTVSSVIKNRGKSALKGINGQTPTDEQFLLANVVSAAVVPSSYSIIMPPVTNQGSESNCGCFALGYYARSAVQRYATGASSYDNSVNVFSPEFIYNQVKTSSDCSGGSTASAILNLMTNVGVCTWAAMPYVDGQCTLAPNNTQLQNAANYKITGYHIVYTTDPSAIKALLVANHPLYFAFNVDSSYYNAGPGFIWSSFVGSILGQHANCIVGYDDSKNAYKVVNQWGTGWGDSGYTWIDYSFMSTVVSSVALYIDGAAPVVAGNQMPVVSAGTDQTITLPTNTATLTGTATDPDGTIASYLWTQLSGPNTAGITTPATASTSITGLIAGTYIFQLTATDNGGLSNSATTKVIVNPSSPPPDLPPIADAGSDITITLPTNSVTLNGSGSYDPDGTITAYAWTQLAGPNTAGMGTPTQAVNFISGLIAGAYQFQLTVTDNNSATASDIMIVNVNPALNIPPIANAGFDSTVISTAAAPLDGSSSSDPDGYIVSYLWSQLSGPNTATLVNTTNPVASASGMIAGTYVFKLVVTDNAGASSFDTVTVTVTAAESIVLSGTPVPSKGKISDVLTWNVSLLTPPQSGLLQISSSATTGFQPLFLIQPFVYNGTYTNVPSSTKKTRYYRLQILKSDNTYAYSNVVHLLK